MASFRWIFFLGSLITLGLLQSKGLQGLNILEHSNIQSDPSFEKELDALLEGDWLNPQAVSNLLQGFPETDLEETLKEASETATKDSKSKERDEPNENDIDALDAFLHDPKLSHLFQIPSSAEPFEAPLGQEASRGSSHPTKKPQSPAISSESNANALPSAQGILNDLHENTFLFQERPELFKELSQHLFKQEEKLKQWLSRPHDPSNPNPAWGPNGAPLFQDSPSMPTLEQIQAEARKEPSFNVKENFDFRVIEQYIQKLKERSKRAV